MKALRNFEDDLTNKLFRALSDDSITVILHLNDYIRGVDDNKVDVAMAKENNTNCLRIYDPLSKEMYVKIDTIMFNFTDIRRIAKTAINQIWGEECEPATITTERIF